MHVIVLARVQAFLPQLQAANQQLEAAARENRSSVDIESFNGTEQSYIQLVSQPLRAVSSSSTDYPPTKSLGLGLFEQQAGNQPANAADRGSSSSSSSTSSSEDDESSTDGGDTSDEEEEEEGGQPDLISLVTGTRPIRSTRPRRNKEPHPGIVVLDSSEAAADSDPVDS